MRSPLGGESLAEVGDGFFQPVLERHIGFPREGFSGEGDVGTALFGVIGGERFVCDARGAAHLFEYEFREFEHRELSRIAEVHRTDGSVLFHKPEEAFD